MAYRYIFYALTNGDGHVEYFETAEKAIAGGMRYLDHLTAWELKKIIAAYVVMDTREGIEQMDADEYEAPIDDCDQKDVDNVLQRYMAEKAEG